MEGGIEHNNHSGSPSLRIRVKNTICCCFKNNQHPQPQPDHHRGGGGVGSTPLSSFDNLTPRLLKSSSQWIRSRANDIPELRDKCRNLITRMGSRRRPQSTDFRYDPLSYALNFDEGEDESDADYQFPARNFSARLPRSPPLLTTMLHMPRLSVSDGAAAVSQEITACN